MFSKFYILFIALHIVSGQLNGEFWWLNDKLAAIRRVEAPPPRFDQTNEFDTDESAKIVFRDNEEFSGEAKSLLDEKPIVNKWPSSLVFKDNSMLAKPIDVNGDIKVNKKTTTDSPRKISAETVEDVFEFVFPESSERDNNVAITTEARTKQTSTLPTIIKKSTKISINDKIWFEDSNTNNHNDTESICTFIKKRECTQNKGVIHKTKEKNCPKLIFTENQRVCCILPHTTQASFMSNLKPIEEKLERYKRSVSIENSSALKQRNAILQRKFVSIPIEKPTASASQTNVPQKIVTPDDIVDPYWNVKNLNLKQPNGGEGSSQNTKYDYVNQDSGDYTDELPKPGLLGHYSDVGPSQTTWKLSNRNKGFYYDGTDYISEEEGDDEETSFGYSSFDPRRGSRVSTTSPKTMRRPMKITIAAAETQEPIRPITFKSKPDFHALEGFKLLNLRDNKNRFVRTTVSGNNNEKSSEETDVKPCPFMNPSAVEYEDLVDEEQQIFKKCGKSVKKYSENIDIDIAEEGFDPWLALVIRTRSRQKIICYATIIHPRAAVTAADCVFGLQAGELSVLTGVWELNKIHSRSQQRLCTVHVHSHFHEGHLENNIALLHWKRPLKLDVNIQPACLADPHVGDECYFVGWGGYDQAMENSSRRQKATILTPRKCTERISKPDITLPGDSFCAAVSLRTTVTGVGGPLLCRSGERTSVVGLAVWRDDVVVLLPVLQWLVVTLNDILQL